MYSLYLDDKGAILPDMVHVLEMLRGKGVFPSSGGGVAL